MVEYSAEVKSLIEKSIKFREICKKLRIATENMTDTSGALQI